MSGRPTDWSPLGLSSDPVPGDPLTVASAASTFQGVADAISTAETNLRNISMNGQGETIDKIRKNCTDLADKISKAHSVCDGADDALNPYVEALETAQEGSVRELENARQQTASRTIALKHREQVRASYNASQDAQERDQLRSEFQQWDSRVVQADQAVGDARRRLNDIIERRDQAAELAASKLRSLIECSGLKDTFWDKVCGAARKVSEWLEKIKPWLDKISAILSVASIIVALIPGLQPLAAVLKIASAVLAVGSLLTGLMVNGRKLIDGQMGWGEFLFTTGMDVLGAVGAVKGASKALGALGKSQPVSAAGKYVKDVGEWASKASNAGGKAGGLSGSVKSFGKKVMDVWKGGPFERGVAHRYYKHLLKAGDVVSRASGIKYEAAKVVANDVYKGTRNMLKDKMVDYGREKWGLSPKNDKKAMWEYYFPGKIKKILAPVP